MALSASFNGIQLTSHRTSSNRFAPSSLSTIARPWLASESRDRLTEGRGCLVYMGAKGLKTYIKVNKLKGNPEVLKKVRPSTPCFQTYHCCQQSCCSTPFTLYSSDSTHVYQVLAVPWTRKRAIQLSPQSPITPFEDTISTSRISKMGELTFTLSDSRLSCLKQPSWTANSCDTFSAV